uniref:dolichyl-phosphate beta-glucosyltransferase n=2 Tax=Litorilinea aerophila TaxID=1204385 RepID=A0A540VLZ5_9CHLR
MAGGMEDPYARYLRWKTQPLQTTPYLSVVIPTYNEAERIVPTIGAVASYICHQDIPWELIVADDGSKDHTVSLCAGLELANLRILKADQNGGKGSAVQRGVLAARGARILFMDADNSTPIEELERFMQCMDDGYDVVIGSRAAAGAQEAHRTWLRQLMSRVLRTLIRPVLGLTIRDTQCGFKLFTREAARAIFQKQTIMGFSFDLEILYLAHKYGFKIAELPVHWVDAPGSKVDKWKEARRFLKAILQIKWNDYRGLYG